MAQASVIISFYNKIEVLQLVLATFELQSEKDFEIIIADDGSKKEIVQEVHHLIKNSSISIKHCWHKDDGWQKNAILNKAITLGTSNYFIFIDGDCLVHHQFVKEHLKHRSHGVALTGRRVNLSKKISGKITVENIKKGILGKRLLGEMLPEIIRGNGKDLEQGFYFGDTKIGEWLNRKDKGILGSNFSLSRDDLFAVNGFDERFIHPAVGEDTDIEHRLQRNGCKIKTIRNRAIQYHIYHKELPREEARLKFLVENDEAKVTFTPYGIIKKA